MKSKDFLKKYRTALSSLPAPGSGQCHTAILGVANYGVLAGLSTDVIFDDIRRSIPQGSRQVPDREISDAIDRAQLDHRKGATGRKFIPKPEHVVKNGATVLRNIINQGKISEEVDLWEVSPIRIDWPPKEDAINFLSIMYEPTDLIFIGEQLTKGILGQSIRTSAAWINFFNKGGHLPSLIMINPLNGIACEKKSGDGISLRGDANIAVFKFGLAEHDDLTKEDQIKFWAAINMPIRALVDSGGKSIHGWIDLQALGIKNLEQWSNFIKHRLYNQILTPLGVDSACSNPSRLSRLPGHFRTEKGNYQRILWLSPKGGKVIR